MSLTVCPVGHVICPYNKSHVIRAERIQFHLTKCLPNAGDKPFVVCPFNSTHLIPATEINNHKTNLCPDRNKLDEFLYEIAGAKPLFPVKTFVVESSENWDDCVGHTYNPEEAIADKKILVLKQVAPPSERKKFNAEQRKKFQSLANEPISNAKHNTNNNSNNKTKPRLPNTKSMTQDVHLKKNEAVKKETTQIQVEEKKILPPIVDKMENLTVMEKLNVPEKKKPDEFELVVGKKKNKKTKNAANQKEAVKTKETQQPKKDEPKIKKQAVLNEKNTNENLKITREEPVNIPSKENVSEEPKEDDFIVVTKKKNKSRKH